MRQDLAMNLAHYKTKYGELPQDDGMFSADLVELSEQQAQLIIEGMETLVGVLGSVIQGLGMRRRSINYVWPHCTVRDTAVLRPPPASGLP